MSAEQPKEAWTKRKTLKTLLGVSALSLLGVGGALVYNKAFPAAVSEPLIHLPTPLDNAPNPIGLVAPFEFGRNSELRLEDAAEFLDWTHRVFMLLPQRPEWSDPEQSARDFLTALAPKFETEHMFTHSYGQPVILPSIDFTDDVFPDDIFSKASSISNTIRLTRRIDTVPIPTENATERAAHYIWYGAFESAHIIAGLLHENLPPQVRDFYAHNYVEDRDSCKYAAEVLAAECVGGEHPEAVYPFLYGLRTAAFYSLMSTAIAEKRLYDVPKIYESILGPYAGKWARETLDWVDNGHHSQKQFRKEKDNIGYHVITDIKDASRDKTRMVDTYQYDFHTGLLVLIQYPLDDICRVLHSPSLYLNRLG